MRPIIVASLVLVVVITASTAARADPRVAYAAFPPIQTQSVAPPPPPPRVPRAIDARATQVDAGAQELRWVPPASAAAPAPRDGGDARTAHRVSDDWMLSIDAVTHAPLDAGFQLGFEAPPGLRLSGGYGFVPGAYVALVTHAAGNASGADPLATSLITGGFQGGHVWRIQGGIRPFSKVGLYLDAGYARVALSGALDSSSVPGLAALRIRGGYSVDTSLDMWLLELGYQAHVGDHVVLAVGAGVMGTLAAHTTVSVQPGSAGLPAIGSSTTSAADRLLVQHGFLPTLSVRLGFDLI